MDSLRIYNVETAATATTLDLGSAAPESSADSPLRVLNLNDTYQAEDVSVTVAGADGIQLWLSTDGDTFTATITVGDIPPGGSSDTFWLRRVTPGDSPTGPRSAQLNAAPASWTRPIDTSTSDNLPITE